ncbi:DUF202 domain-containing protein [Streptomyces albidoflavus]|uniref:DUF202 domain-containing protein n=1 Tax=Streptomyces albidoflavus TaxID=1886 RepID=UPI0033A6F8DF
MSTQAVRDPGLQPERTRLAWRRTTLSCTVVAVLAARAALHRSGGAAGLLALTVDTHARRLFKKLGASDRAHAVALGFRWGLVR